MKRNRERQFYWIHILCRLFGHNIVKRLGDCFVASSTEYCNVKVTWNKCTRGDYNQMEAHTHVMKPTYAGTLVDMSKFKLVKKLNK